MNDYKTIHNETGGTLIIPEIAPSTDGSVRYQDLVLSPAQTLDLSTLYGRLDTQRCVALDAALANGYITCSVYYSSIYGGATGATGPTGATGATGPTGPTGPTG